MGDRERHQIMANFIKRNYAVGRVLVVADGRAQLGKALHSYGYKCIVIDPKPRWRVIPGISYVKGFFHENSNFDVDLIVGMHPDEATAPIITNGILRNIPFCLVPCCVVGEYSKGVHGFWGWLKRLHSLSNFSALEKTLPMRGKNILIYKK